MENREKYTGNRKFFCSLFRQQENCLKFAKRKSHEHKPVAV